MSKLAEFFKGEDTKFGVFYPTHCLLAVFPNWRKAMEAYQQLRSVGFNDEEVTAVPGEDAVEFADEYLKKHGLWTVLMTQLSRFFDTEATYADHDLALAKKGAGFIAIHCPTNDAMKSAWRHLRPLQPVVARYYRADGVEHLAGET